MYFEEARAAYWREVAGRGGLDDIDYIMGEASIRWRQRVLWPQTLRVGVRVSRLGKRHFEMEYEVRSAEGECLVTGRTLQVMYDYAAESTKPIPEAVRDAIAALDGPFGPGGKP